MMKKALMLMLAGAALASCSPTERGAGIGAASGAIIGGAVTGNVQEQPGQCYYRDRYGRRYIDDCPRGGY
jgi:hypothetical protein